jgi:hypothetical protein
MWLPSKTDLRLSSFAGESCRRTVVTCTSSGARRLKDMMKLETRVLRSIVPVRMSYGVRYVRMREVPEPAQIFFRWRMSHSSHPFIDEDSHPKDCAYDYDWHDFLSRGR